MRSASTVAAWMEARNAVRLAPSQPPRVSTSTLGIVSLLLVDQAHFAHAPRPGRRTALPNPTPIEVLSHGPSSGPRCGKTAPGISKLCSGRNDNYMLFFANDKNAQNDLVRL